MVRVNSTALEDVTFKLYGPSTIAGSLRIAFDDGRTVTYSNVPERVYKALVAAPSAGAYFNLNIRNHYPVQGGS